MLRSNLRVVTSSISIKKNYTSIHSAKQCKLNLFGRLSIIVRIDMEMNKLNGLERDNSVVTFLSEPIYLLYNDNILNYTYIHVSMSH